ncbi:MAG: hypothetical protein HW387_357 [Parachlamydiales bacterium]|nr:hypothetical protein [Parachlamydiales bacterium]
MTTTNECQPQNITSTPTVAARAHHPQKSMCEKIWRAVKRAFHWILVFFRIAKVPKLDPIKSVSSAPQPVAGNSLPAPKIVPIQQPAPEQKRISSSLSEAQPIESSNDFDDSLKRLCTFVEKFVQDSVTAASKQFVEPQIEGISKSAENIPKLLEQLGTFVLGIGGNKKPIFELLKNCIPEQDVTNTITSLVEGIQPENRHLLQDALTIKLKALGPQGNQPGVNFNGFNLNEIAQIALTWAIDKRQEKLYDFFSRSLPTDPNNKSWIEKNNGWLDVVAEQLGHVLIHRKLEELKGGWEDKLIHKLTEIIPQCLEKNGAKLGKVLSIRIATLIEKLPYSRLFDNLLTGINKHAVDYSKALSDRSLPDKRDKIAYAHQLLNDDNSSEKEILEAKQYLESIGDEQEYLKAELENLVIPPPQRDSDNSKAIGKLADELQRLVLGVESLTQEPDHIRKEYNLKLETLSKLSNLVTESVSPGEENPNNKVVRYSPEFAKQMTDLLLELLLGPPQKAHGYEELLGLFELPKEIDDLLNQVSQMIGAIVTPQRQVYVNVIKGFLKKAIVAFVLDTLKKEVDKKFREILADLLEKFYVSDVFNEFLADIILPNFNTTLEEMVNAPPEPNNPGGAEIESLPIYGELAENLVCKVGQLGTLGSYAVSYLKKPLAKAISRQIHDFRVSHVKILHLSLNGLEKAFNSPDVLSQLFFSDKAKQSSETIEKKRTSELEKTAILLHKITLKNLSGLTKIAVGKYLGKEGDLFNAVIGRILNGYLGNGTIAKTLTFRVVEAFRFELAQL